jgi:MSHA biogenesis protein MshJ
VIKEKLLKLQQQVDGLNQRERILIMLTALVTVVMLLQLVLLDPLLAERSQAQKQLKRLQSDKVTTTAAIELLTAELTVGVNRQEIRQHKQLTKELTLLDEKIQHSVKAMIPPQQMPKVLEALLSESKGLRLVTLENQPVRELLTQLQKSTVDNGQREQQSEKQPSLYNHAFMLQLNGDYASIIEYFKKLSALPWHFQWDELHYKVDQYPSATVRLKVHTVSMDEEWIGV